MSSPPLSRRHFCVITGLGVVAGACGSGASSDGGADLSAPFAPSDMSAAPDLPDPTCPVGSKINVGPSTAFIVGQSKFFRCSHLLVLRDAGGIYAMTSICTHEGCDIAFAPATHDFECPCHQSVYNFNGVVTDGPAILPLTHFAVSLDGSGDVIVDLGTAGIDPATRLQIQD